MRCQWIHATDVNQLRCESTIAASDRITGCVMHSMARGSCANRHAGLGHADQTVRGTRQTHAH